ncbi:MAG: universal stress protein, partial [Bradyrhizobium sp.]|nr:universal stress protein [Bradyrhizobium sp.]
MPFKDILVALNSYPDPTPVSVVEDAVAVAATLGAHLAAISCETHVQLPGHFISAPMVDGMIAGEVAKSRKSAHELLAAFDAAAAKAGILHEAIFEKCLTLEIPDLLVEYARLRDLTIL